MNIFFLLLISFINININIHSYYRGLINYNIKHMDKMESNEINSINNAENISKVHKFEENQYKDIKIWKQKQNTSSDGIIQKIMNYKRLVKDSLRNITGEENDDINKIKEITKKKNIFKASKSSQDIDLVSENAKKILNNINKHIKKIKESNEDITALNALYLDNTIFENKKNKNKNKNNISKISPNNSLNKISNSQEVNLIPDDNYNKAIEKKEGRNNFVYVNNTYRRQLDKSFMKFNPLVYLNNLKVLLRASPLIKDDVKKTKNDVEEDIKFLCDKRKYQKKFNAYLAKNNRSRSVEANNQNIYKSNDNINFNRKKKLIINTNININSNNASQEDIHSPKNINNKPKFVILPKIIREVKSPKDLSIGKNIFEKLKKKEYLKSQNIKDQKIDEINKMYDITKEIGSFIGKKNINEKVDKFIYDYKLQNYYRNLRDNENKSNIKSKDYYLEQKSKINDMLGNLYINKIQKRAKEKEQFYGDKIRRDKNDYFLKIDNELQKSLNEFDNNIILNQINLNDSEINNESSDEINNNKMEL